MANWSGDRYAGPHDGDIIHLGMLSEMIIEKKGFLTDVTVSRVADDGILETQVITAVGQKNIADAVDYLVNRPSRLNWRHK